MMQMAPLIYLVCCLMVAAAIPARNEALGPDLCVVNTPLLTRFFKAWSESPASTRGCYVPSPVKTTQEVHLIRLMNTPSMITNEVTLEIANGNTGVGGRGTSPGLVLILDADVAVKWNIRATGIEPQLQHTIIVTGNSEVDQTDIRASVTSRPKENRMSLIRFAERRYKWIHSMSEIESANRLRLTLAAPVNATATKCDFESNQTSPVVQAWKVDKQSIEGCFHHDQAGTYPKGDVHIIDLDNSINPDQDLRIHLAAGDPEMNESRDLALVLKSSRPVRWVLSSAPQLKGLLVILSEHEVVNSGVSAHQNIEVRSRNIPDAFAILILETTSDLGPPVSYIKTQAASRVELVINKKARPNSKAKTMSGAASHSSPSMELGVRSLDGFNHHTPIRGGGSRSPTWTLQQAIRVQCGSHLMTASLPRPMSEALGVTAIWLSDRNCVGKRNSTHWSVQTHVTSCSSTSRIDGKLTTYSNLVHIQLGDPQESDDEDMEGSGLGSESLPGPESGRQLIVPIQCHYEPNFPIGGFDKMDDDNVMDAVELPEGQMELYHMEIHRNKEWTIPVSGDLSKGQSAAEVVFDETLHVRAWIDGVSYIQIVVEKCWVSNSSSSAQPARLILIRNTCPADISVRIRENAQGSNSGFSFHVSKDYADLGQLYIHCKLGLCTNDPSKAQGNLKSCIDPSQYCTGRHVLKPFLEESVSTAQQILVRGPLRMVHKISPLPSRINEAGESASIPIAPNQSGLPSTQVIVVGVSTEVTVGIALASFVIGVGLTAILWCIHMRTDPYRRVNNGKNGASRSSSQQRCSGVKCGSPVIRGRMEANRPSTNPSQNEQQQQEQQPLANPQLHYQFSYDYDVSSQSNSSGSQSSREEASPTPNSQTPMNASH